MSPVRIQRAIISVSDKQGLSEFASGLVDHGIEVFSTGGTRKHLEAAGVPVRDISEYTTFPEIMDGRVKTLHPKVHGGILFRRDHAEDVEAVQRHEMLPFDLVAVNLYPFAQTLAKPDVTDAEIIEQIDIGGPSMVRAAAKNHAFVAVVTDPGQYAEVMSELSAQGGTTESLRRKLAGAAFEHTAQYDRVIADYFAREHDREAYPAQISVSLTRREKLRYGENPHQSAALYSVVGASERQLASAQKLHGKELSYNNLLDLNSALAIAKGLPTGGVAVIKHNNPCGAAAAADLGTATRAALDGDAQSAFGSVIGFNVPVDAAAADVMAEPGRFVEAIVAPDFSAEALEILTTRPKWKANVRLIAVGQWKPPESQPELRQIDGGMLVQLSDMEPDPESEWKVVTKSQPTDNQLADLRFGWAVVRHVKSNAIVLAKEKTLIGVGAGQMSRVDSVEIAIRKAGERASGSVLASDAFFPFADSIDHAVQAGIAAVIQPGGSRNDDEVIAACDRHGLPMVLTGRRHFKH